MKPIKVKPKKWWKIKERIACKKIQKIVNTDEYLQLVKKHLLELYITGYTVIGDEILTNLPNGTINFISREKRKE